MFTWLATLFVAFVALSQGASAAVGGADDPVLVRVEALLRNLSVTEKLHQLLRPDWSDGLASSGVGLLEFQAIYAGAANATAVAVKRNSFQRQLLTGSGPRLPAAFRLFSIHGSEAFGTTFPEGPGLGASWDYELMRDVARVIAVEGRALGADMWLPVINLWSDARFGRQQEGFSEEPTLTAALAAAAVEGAHGTLGLPPDAYLDPTTQIACLFKHVGAYAAALGGLNGARADVPEHTVREVYLKPWRRAAAAGARGVMPSHNTVLNVPAHASTWLLRDRLRGDFNWSLALFVSDTGDVAALRGFRLCDDDASCAALALSAGVDIEQVPSSTYLALPEAVSRGLVPASAIDDAVRRVLVHKFSARLFDNPYVNESLAAAVVNAPAHRALALTAAEEGCVLLINRGGALPLTPGAPLRIAVVGALGGCGTSGSGDGTLPLCAAQSAMLGNYAESQPAASGVDTVAQALRAAAGAAAATVTFDRGADPDDSSTAGIAAAVAAAAAADVVVAVLGDSGNTAGEGHDRDDLDLPGSQMPLLRAVAALGKPLIVVLIHGRAPTFGAADGNAVLGNVSALLAAHRPGQMGGAAIANIVWGAANPSGRLPHSWVRSVGHAGGGATPWQQERVALWGGGPSTGAEGRHYGSYVGGSPNPVTTPLFAFGEGLSYTTFALETLVLTPQLPANTSYPLLVAVSVRNAGARVGDAVVQVYVQDPVGIGRVVRPWKRLLAFGRARAVPPGGAVPLTLAVRADDLALIDDVGVLRVVPGTYTVSVGQSSIADNGAGMTCAFTVAAGDGFEPRLEA